MQVHQRPGQWPPSRPSYPAYRPPATPPPLPPKPPKNPLPARRRVILALVVGLFVTAAGITAANLLTAHKGNSYPAAWDSRITGLVRFVEEERALEFEHPVYVDYLSEADYKARITTEIAMMSEQDKADLANFTAMDRALGIISADVDLVKASSSLNSDGTLAYYDPETERITVRGTEMSVAMRVTLVHELTHVAQDQHFGIDRTFGTDGAQVAFRALVEGDAVRIENRYVDHMVDSDREAYDKENEATIERAEDDLSDVPDALQTLFGAPYPLGEQFVGVVMGSGSQRALDKLFRKPPTSELVLLDPAAWLNGDDELRAVKQPSLRKGEKEIVSGDFGALMLYTMLASRIDPLQALNAVEGWDGDAYVAYEKAGTTCIRIALAGSDREATGLLHDALTAWAAQLTPSTPKVTLDGTVVNVVACDPGTKADRPTRDKATHRALFLPVTRGMLISQFLDLGAPEDVSVCVGDTVIRSFTLDELSDPEGKVAETDGFEKKMHKIVDDCSHAAPVATPDPSTHA